MSPYRKPSKNAQSVPASSDDLATTNEPMLDFVRDHASQSRNPHEYTMWKEEMPYFTSSNYPETCNFFQQVPGSVYKMPSDPKVGHGGATAGTLDECKRLYARRTEKISLELKSLHGMILSRMTASARNAFSNHQLWNEHSLNIPNGETVHFLLKAIHVTFMSDNKLPKQQVSVEALQATITGAMTGTSLEVNRREHDVRIELAATLANHEFTAAEEAYIYFTRDSGRSSTLTRRRSTDLRRSRTRTPARSTTWSMRSGGWNATFVQTRGAISAFAVDFQSNGKKGGRDKAFSAGDDAEYIKASRERVKKLSKENSSLKKEVERLKKDLEECRKSSADKAANGDDRRRDERDQKRHRKCERDRGERDRNERDRDKKRDKAGKADDGNMRQRRLEPGANGKNQPTSANAAQSDTDDDTDYHSDGSSKA